MKKTIMFAVVLAFTAALTAAASDAKGNWDTLCAKCHGADGKGQTNMGRKLGVKDYSDPQVQTALKDEAAFKAIKEGFKAKDGKTVMRPAENLSDEDIKGLVAYLRTFKK